MKKSRLKWFWPTLDVGCGFFAYYCEEMEMNTIYEKNFSETIYLAIEGVLFLGFLGIMVPMCIPMFLVAVIEIFTAPKLRCLNFSNIQINFHRYLVVVSNHRRVTNCGCTYNCNCSV